MTEPNATPAQLTMTPADEAADRELLRYCSLHRMPVDTSMVDRAWAECDATRAKLAEAEAHVRTQVAELDALHAQVQMLVNAQPQVCVCETDPTREIKRKLTAAESRVAALTEALTNARTHVYCGCSRPRVRHDHDCPRGKVEAALSPSQDAKDGGAV